LQIGKLQVCESDHDLFAKRVFLRGGEKFRGRRDKREENIMGEGACLNLHQMCVKR